MMRGRKVWFAAGSLACVLVLLAFVTHIDAGQQTGGKEISLVSSHDLEFYMSPLSVDFVRPGLTVQLEDPTIGSDRRPRVNIRITDNLGLPLDRDGIASPGPVSLSFIVAHLPSEDSTYVAYTTRQQTSSLTGVTAIQAGTDSGGIYQQLEDGLYQYTFGTALPLSYPGSETHAIGVYATRDLRDFELDRQYANDVLEFVPDGSPVIVRRDRVSTAACNTCHDPLALHGGARRETQLCILCHSAQTSDPDTGNTVDFKVMIHKIHRGEDLPSVQDGTPYRIIGFRNSVHDYSNVVFPGDVRRCDQCHQGGTQSTAYLTRPSRAACGSCHDDVNFATGESHAGIAQANDTQCATCHLPAGDLEFDLSIAGAHTIPEESTQLPGVVFEILGVEDGTAGKRPTVNFSIRDNNGNPVDLADMSRLALVLSGPTSDFVAWVSESALEAEGSNGLYAYTFETLIPFGFKGTVAVGIEGYQNQALLKSDGTSISVRDAGLNDVFYFHTAGETPSPRRSVVDLDKCNSCHGALSLHGSNRNNTEQCVLCHNPAQTDERRRPPEAGAPESVHFKTMIHKIHTGEELPEDFTVFGFGSRPHTYSEVRFPGDRRNCTTCHIDGTQQLPLPSGVEASLAPRGLISPLPPTAAACLSCHTGLDALIHTSLQTSALGESCAVCHGPNREFSVDRSHAR